MATLRAIPPHRKVARSIEFLEDDTNYCLIFECYERGDLCEEIIRCNDGRLSERMVKKYTVEIIVGLVYFS